MRGVMRRGALRTEPGRTDARVWAAQLAAVLYVLGAVSLLALLGLLPASVPRLAIVQIAMLALVSAALLLLLPWRSFPRWTTAMPLVWGVFMVSLTGAYGGALHHFLLFYALASLYVGLTQPRGAWVWFLPVNLGSVALALAGREPAGAAVDLFSAATLAVVIAEVLAAAVARSEVAASWTERLLEAVTMLHGAVDEDEAAQVITRLTRTMLRPDGVIVMLSAGTSTPLFTNRGQWGVDLDLGELVIDTDTANGIGRALRSGAPLLVPDTTAEPLLDRRAMGRVSFRSLLFIPVPGEVGHVGCIVAGWLTKRAALSGFEDRAISVLAQQSGALMERLRSVGVLEHEARTDPLTGLDNRRSFLGALDTLRGYPGAVVFLDLDHFKDLNDSQGHQAGDQVLVAFATALRACVRDGDSAARYGGEEFALVVHGHGDMTRATQAVVRRLRDRWDGPVTFSAGIAVHQPGDPPSTTLARADAALYQAKAEGRNRAIVG